MNCLQSLLRILDVFAGIAVLIVGCLFFISSIDPVMYSLEGFGQSTNLTAVISCVLLSVILVVVGVYFLSKRLGFLESPVQDSQGPATASVQQVRVATRSTVRCPKPPMPKGPINVVEVREEWERSEWETVRKRSHKKGNVVRTKSAASRSDDLSIGSILDISTTVCDQTPVAEISPISVYKGSMSPVPDTIAAIWETVPRDNSNIWGK
jgi:hypothetical protein